MNKQNGNSNQEASASAVDALVMPHSMHWLDTLELAAFLCGIPDEEDYDVREKR